MILSALTVAALALSADAFAFKTKGSAPAKVPKLISDRFGAPPAKRSEAGKETSEAVPFLARPDGLDSLPIVLPGDYGFDPLNLADTQEKLLQYRDAEIKHGRIAMLAALGWPISELFDGKLAKVFGLTDIIAQNYGKAPSVLNGGLGKVPLGFWLVVVGVTAAIEVQQQNIIKQADAQGKRSSYLPGDFGFDPLNLFPKNEENRKKFLDAETNNGRLAMLAIVGFAIQEAFTNVAVVLETPEFFYPN